MNRSLLFVCTAMLVAMAFISSCVKNDFDEPDNNGCTDTKLTSNITIADLKSLYNFTGAYKIEQDLTIEGVVISDDRAGNFYKELVIQDATGGILIMVDQTNIYTSFPEGRKVYIKVKDMYLGDYAGLIQLGASVDEETGDLQRIPQSLVEDYIFKGPCNQSVDTVFVTAGQLNPNIHQSMLVKLTTVRMDGNDADVNFANISGTSAQNRTFKDCNGAEGIFRTSDFANFAGTKTPTETFDMVGVFSVFNNDMQFKLRNFNDITITGAECPCEAVPGPISGTTTFYVDDIFVSDPDQNTLVDEDFETQSFGSPLNLPGWTVHSEAGTRRWEPGDYPASDNNTYARARVYQSGDAEMISWLVTPGLAITSGHYLTFRSFADFVDGAALVEVLVSTDYDGSGSPENFTWEKVCTTIATDNVWEAGGPIQLGDHAGSTTYIAFRYRAGDN